MTAPRHLRVRRILWIGAASILLSLLFVRREELGRLFLPQTSHRQPDLRTQPPVAGAAPAAMVPEPAAWSAAELAPTVCWACERGDRRPETLEFSVDLDWLAPLGDGEGNLASWFKNFGQGFGRRNSKETVVVELSGRSVAALAVGDPVLEEATSWVNQSRCRFYPNVFPIDLWDTYIPDLSFGLLLARGWAAEALATQNPDRATRIARRSVRLGRLLRQDGLTVLQELVALAVIREGAEALQELARRDGDTKEMLLTERVISEADGMRQAWDREITTINQAWHQIESSWRGPRMNLTAAQAQRMEGLARSGRARPIRAEAAMVLRAVESWGRAAAQRDRATAVLQELARDPDPMIAEVVKRLRETSLDLRAIQEAIDSKGPDGS